MDDHLVRLSRAISHALRHEPWLYELELDDDGWTSVEALLAALRRESDEWGSLAEADVAEMIRRSSKQRHEMRGGRIRALYGHSVPGKLRRTRATPPDLLFHGTAPGSAGKIREEGLMPMGRQYVHLSSDRSTAASVGRRKAADYVVLTARALEASRDGVPFYLGNEHVWLADRIPPQYID